MEVSEPPDRVFLASCCRPQNANALAYIRAKDTNLGKERSGKACCESGRTPSVAQLALLGQAG
jgi:hypothetical protein